MIKSYSRGHEIYFDSKANQWLYLDNHESAVIERPCLKCNLECKPNEPDPCLGYLDGVINACCGHGIEGLAYVQKG